MWKVERFFEFTFFTVLDVTFTITPSILKTAVKPKFKPKLHIIQFQAPQADISFHSMRLSVEQWRADTFSSLVGFLKAWLQLTNGMIGCVTCCGSVAGRAWWAGWRGLLPELLDFEKLGKKQSICDLWEGCELTLPCGVKVLGWTKVFLACDCPRGAVACKTQGQGPFSGGLFNV